MKKVRTKVLAFAIALLAVPTVAVSQFAPLVSEETVREHGEVTAFFSENMEQVFKKLFDESSEYPTTLIQSRYRVLSARVEAKYGVRSQFWVTTEYAEASPAITNAKASNNGTPVVATFVPAHMDLYEDMESRGVTPLRETFENNLVIGLIHELEHMAYDPINTSGSPSSEELNRREIRTWAYTCEYTIQLFVDAELPISRSKMAFYDRWVAYGRRLTSVEWTNFITEAYASTR